MKKYRPRSAGFYVLYALALLCASDSVYTLYGQITGTLNQYMSSFSMFSYIILAMALTYVWMYVRTKVVVDADSVRFAFPANIRPKQGESRALFIYRQGDCDLKFIDKTVPMKRIVRWGYVEDLGYERIDKGNADEKNKLFPVHEVAFITDENKRYHWNAALFGKAQRKEIFEQIARASGVRPEGKLEDEMRNQE